MRFAGDYLAPIPVEQKPVVPGFSADDLEVTPEMRPGPYYPGQDLDRDRYIRQNPRSGIAMFPGGEQSPAMPAELYQTVPVETADAGNILREYGNALLSPFLGRDPAPFGRTGMFGQEDGRDLGIMESAERSVKRINNRNAATEEAIQRLLRK